MGENKLTTSEHRFVFQPPLANVLVEFDEGIAWVTLNRPAKRNAMSPALNDEMVRVLDALEIDERVAAEAARAAVRGATPTEKNSYKVAILEAVVRRTILQAQ